LSRKGSGVRLTVSDEIRKTFPELRIGVLVARHLDNTGTDDRLDELKRVAADRIPREFTYETLGELPEITAWREAYRTFGVKPKDSRPTAEAFLRRLVKGEEFPTISKAVDSYLLVETEYHLPVGGYDLATITRDICLRVSPGDEAFQPIGTGAEEVTRSGEVVYADDARVLTRKWNFRDCDHCKIAETSTDIVLFTEAPFTTVGTDRLRASIDLMAEHIERFCGAEVTAELFDCARAGEFPLP